jgi:hypothetical protein
MTERKPSKFVRTVMRTQDGQYVTARINKDTGEIKPFTYRTKPKPIVATFKERTEPYVPFWVGMPICGEDSKRQGSIDSSKAIENPFFGMFDLYDVYSVRNGGVGSIVSAGEELDEDAMDDAIVSLVHNMPFLDNYFEGIANLGESNPLSKNVMFRLLRSLPEISSNTIYQATNYSPNYCQRLATALRVFIKLTT